MTDQHRIDTLGCYGNADAQTPNLDHLAESGTKFDEAFTPTAICTPARTSLLTGEAPFRHRVLANSEWNIGYRTDLSKGEFTFSEELRRHDYQVGLIGKWHVGDKATPSDYGFDGPHFPGAINPVLHSRYQEYLADNRLPAVRFHDAVRGVLPGNRPGHLLAARLEQPVEATFEHFLANLAIEMLHNYVKNDQPFSLSLHFFGPHLPYVIPDQYFDMIDPDSIRLPNGFSETFAGKPPVQRRYSEYWSADSLSPDQWRKLIAVYRGYVALIDFEIGRVLGVLDDLGQRDSTTVFFTADHGEFTGSHRLNDKGPAMYDDIYRIPLLVRSPGAPAGCARTEFVTLTDLSATILEIAGADPDCVVDGRSLLPLVQGQSLESWRSDFVGEFHGHHFHYQQRMLRTRTHKLVVNPESFNELYDLVADPAELTNLYTVPAYDAIRRELCLNLYHQLVERGDDVFAKWMAATTDFDVPLRNTGRNDYDAIAAE